MGHVWRWIKRKEEIRCNRKRRWQRQTEKGEKVVIYLPVPAQFSKCLQWQPGPDAGSR